MELNSEGFKMQKWNISTDRTQTLDEKNGVVCLVIMFTNGVMVIKMAHSCVFCWWQQKSVTVWAKHLSASESASCLALSEDVWIFGFWATISRMLTLKNTRFRYFFWYLSCLFGVSTLGISRTVTSKLTILTIPFSERTREDL